jgi:hypothetical protein
VVYNADYFQASESEMVAIHLPSYNVTNMRLDWSRIGGTANVYFYDGLSGYHFALLRRWRTERREEHYTF